MGPLLKKVSSQVEQPCYFCNGCQEDLPSRRFHCLRCPDFDLCERCYFYTGHPHEMRLEEDARERQLLKLSQGVARRSESLQHSLSFLSTLREFESKKLSLTVRLK